MSLMGVDIGGSGVKGAVVDVTSGALLTERVRVPTPQPSLPKDVAATVAQLERVDGVTALGITLPAVVRHGVCETAANIDPSWIGVDAVSLFSDAVGLPCHVVNDADAAGLAEVRFGAGRDAKGVVVLITLGTGIGSAVFTSGQLVPNTELGHLSIHRHDADAWASAATREREELSWKKWARRLTAYLRHVESLTWPELFIIGGGVSRKGDKFIPLLDVSTPVVPAQFENDAGIIGAALIAHEHRGRGTR